MDDELKAAVAKAWHNANEGGYAAEFEGETFEQIARDMIAFCDDIADCVDGEDQGSADYHALEVRIVALLPEVTGRAS